MCPLLRSLPPSQSNFKLYMSFPQLRLGLYMLSLFFGCKKETAMKMFMQTQNLFIRTGLGGINHKPNLRVASQA